LLAIKEVSIRHSALIWIFITLTRSGSDLTALTAFVSGDDG